MKLTLTCEHGTRALEVDEGCEGVGNSVPTVVGGQSYAAQRIAALMPRCPYCDLPWQPRFVYEAEGK